MNRTSGTKQILLLIPCAVACMLLAVQPLHAAAIVETWNGGAGTGTFTWEVAANWTPSANYPGDGLGGNTYRATVGDATGDRVIQTTGAISVNKMDWAQTSSGGSNTLKLGGNFTINNTTGGLASAVNSWTNTTANASTMILDLNGFDFTYSSAGNPNTTGYIVGTGTTVNNAITVRSTGALGGVFDVNAINTASNFHVEDNVTIRISRQSGNANLTGTGNSFSAASTLQIANTSVNPSAVTLTGGTTTLSNLTIGDSSLVSKNTTTIGSTTTVVSGNMTINTYSGATGGDASIIVLASGKTLKVAGNFTDAATNASDYGLGTITFNGGAGVAKQVSIQRTALTTNFSVGDSGGTAGNVQLQESLATTGTFTVLGTSILDVDNHTAQAGAANFDSGSTLGLTFGSTNGLVSATNLTLGSFNLILAQNGAWVDGSNLTLFSYTGTLTGTPSLLSISAPDLPNFSYGSLVNDTLGKTIYLSNVNAVPEPSAIFLLLLSCGAFFGWAFRRHMKQKSLSA